MRIYITDREIDEYLRKLESRESVDNVDSIVAEILENVKNNGDSALKHYGKKFDNTEQIVVLDNAELKKYYEKQDREFALVLENALENIKRYHEKQVRTGYEIEDGTILLGQRIRPLEKVGIYVPGGLASYPSSVLMNAIPAKIAGVKQLIMITPPPKFENQNLDVLSAAYLAGVDKVFFVGGAHGIAALAYGTETIPKVDKIVGPGNSFVASAKKQIFGKCDIDMIAGPSEILVVADDTARADFVASDLLSQAEHDTKAACILLTDNIDFAKQVLIEMDKMLKNLSKKDIIQTALNDFGGIIICNSLQRMIELSNQIAPEHLELCIENAEDYIDEFYNVGSIFLGNYTPEPLGDYYGGTNHILPTNGSARFFSPLSVDSFYKKYSYIKYAKDDLDKVISEVELFANREKLSAHANSLTVRKSPSYNN